MLTLNHFAEGLRYVCPESILFSAVLKPEVDFVKHLVKQQTDEVPENHSSVYSWIRKSANVEDFLHFICEHLKRKNIKNWITDKGAKQ